MYAGWPVWYLGRVLGFRAMTPVPTIIDDDAGTCPQTRADAAALSMTVRADICDWLETWDTPDEKPPPDAWFALHPVDDAADDVAIARGKADIAAGRVISHKAMKAWLLSWGTDHELPPPQVGE